MKKHRGLKIFGIVILAIMLFMVTINIIPPKKVMEINPFISTNGLPMIAAHRGGSINNPENTKLAFEKAVSDYQVDIIESDLWLTKDDKLVYNHDEYIDRTCDVNGDISIEEVQELIKDSSKRHYIRDYTLEELEQFNFGYYFEDENGNRPYKSLVENITDIQERKNILESSKLQIVELSDLFEQYYQTNKDLLFIVEIKNGGEEGFTAAKILDDLLTNFYPDYKNQVVIGTFHDEINNDLKNNHPTLLRGASTGVAAKFIVTQFLGVNLFDTDNFACLQIPMTYDIGFNLKLDKVTIINRAHRRNISVQYWTINDESEMRRLISLNCDAIMSDNPALLREVLNSYR